MSFLGKIYNAIMGFMFGVKNTETEMFTQLGGSATADSSVTQEVNENRVSKALLKGEITQQVKELRYRTYTVDREAKKMEYFSPTLVKKRENDDSKFVKYENNDNLEVITIQTNERLTENVNDAFSRVIEGENGKYTYIEPDKKYIIELGRKYIARYKMEEFVKRLVVKELAKDKRALLDFYVSKYADDSNFISKGFITEINKIKDGNTNSDVIDIDTVHFVTSHAYKKDDMLEYEFDNLKYVGILEYDGNYIVRFTSDIAKNGFDLTEKYYDQTMHDKYANHEKKDIVLDFSNHNEVYVCEMCGKEVMYDEQAVDELMPTMAREIDNDSEKVTSTTEYMDMQVTEQTYGKRLCNNCLAKYLKQINELK